jgi:hypothetical protein
MLGEVGLVLMEILKSRRELVITKVVLPEVVTKTLTLKPKQMIA